MSDVYIKAASAIGAWGIEQKDFYEGFKQKRNMIGPLSDDSRFGESFDLHGALISEIDFKKWLAPGERRRKDIYSKLALLASKLALNPLEGLNFHYMELIITHETLPGQLTRYLDDLFIHGPKMTSPKLFPTMANNSKASTVAQAWGIHGQSFGQANILMASFSMIESAFERIGCGLAEEVLTVSTDYLSPGFVNSYDQLNVYKKNMLSPLGTYPGEGAATILFSNDFKNSVGKISELGSSYSQQVPYKWPKDREAHFQCLKDLFIKYKPEQYFSAGNGDAEIEVIENFVIEKLEAQTKHKFEVFRIKDLLGEHSPIVSFQVVLSLLAPKGTKSLISVLGPGGQHGAILVESFGNLESRYGT